MDCSSENTEDRRNWKNILHLHSAFHSFPRTHNPSVAMRINRMDPGSGSSYRIIRLILFKTMENTKHKGRLKRTKRNETRIFLDRILGQKGDRNTIWTVGEIAVESMNRVTVFFQCWFPSLEEFVLVIQNSILEWGWYTLKLLGVMGHHLCSLLPKRSRKKTNDNGFFFPHWGRETGYTSASHGANTVKRLHQGT